MENSKVVGKFIIVNDLMFSDFMKDENGKICVYDTYDEACNTCGIYEFDDALVLEVKYNHIEKEIETYRRK